MQMPREIKKVRIETAERPAKERAKTFDEVNLGYTFDQAVEEAIRCIQCKNQPCVQGCPVEVPIPEFIEFMANGDMASAIAKNKEKNNLPGICGRVCPQETQCEAVCTMGKLGDPINIGKLERYVADWELEHKNDDACAVGSPKCEPKKGKKVAVVGAGPSGLTCAGDLARMGYDVTIFEALHKPGGVLAYGIPPFRLPRPTIEAEVDYVKSLGVEIRYNQVIGKIQTLEELFAGGYKAIFLGTGAGLPSFLKIPGANANGVFSANEYLTRINLMNAKNFPEVDTPIWKGKRVAVVGCGNVAMDSVRSALRLGADKAMIIYRRTIKEMTAREEEYHHAHEEGVDFNWLTNPVEIVTDDKNFVKALKLIKMELGEPDDSGRRRPIPIKGSEYLEEVDTVIIALGTSPNPLIPSVTPKLKTSRWGTYEADDKLMTSYPGVFTGGDALTGAATVIEAMGAGKVAARSIAEYIGG